MANGVHLMTEKRKTWIVSAAISFGFYLVCVFLGAFVNVCISMTAGYSSFADYKASGYDPGILLVLIFTLINHIFFSWLTVRLASRYAIKHKNHTMVVYYIAMASVITCTIINTLLMQAPGILTVIIHLAAIFLFGLYICKHPKDKQNNQDNVISTTGSLDTNTAFVERGTGSSVPSAQPQMIYCHICGSQVPDDSPFCHKCGAKLK